MTEETTGLMSILTPTPRESPLMGLEPLTVIVISVACVVFLITIIMLVVVLYRKEPLCCRYRPHTTDDSLHYHSRHSLIGVAHNEHGAAMNQGARGSQLPGRVFIIGMPNDYHLGGPLPRLPSYESVRKKDRQRHIHNMIAHRFGLSDCHDEPPPTYEETLRQSFDISPADLESLDINLSVHTQDHSSHISDGTDIPSQPSTALQGSASSY